MKLFTSRCILCGRVTHQRCQYCDEPICSHCQVANRGKVYCSMRHRDMDAGLGHIFRHLTRSSV